MGQQLDTNKLHKARLEREKVKAEKKGSDGNFRDGLEHISSDIKEGMCEHGKS